jgi:hypothetical protein
MDKFQKAGQLQVESKDSVAKIRGSSTEFLLRELAMGITLAELAHFSEKRGHPEDADRQKAAAIQAYKTVVKFLPEVAPTSIQERQIEADMAQLKYRLTTLGVSLA